MRPRTAAPVLGRSPVQGRARWARWAVPALALLLGACIDEEREQMIGDRIAAQVNAQVPLVTDPLVMMYVNDLGNYLAAHSDRPDVPYTFYVVDAAGLNAFALPGGHVYVNRGLIERTRTVSELAGILSHEIAHVAARHGAQNLQRHMRTGSLAGVMYRLILGREPLLDQDALNIGRDIWHAQHSRRDEAEADRMAVRLMIDSGLDPAGMLRLFHLLLEEERQENGPAEIHWLATHPDTEARIEATTDKIERLVPDDGAALARNVDSYPAFLLHLRSLPPAAIRFYDFDHP